MIEKVGRPDLKTAPWRVLANRIRAKGQVVTPFRLGYEVGLACVHEACPYSLPRSAELYRDGVMSGSQFRRDLVRRRAQNEAKQ